MKFVQNLIFMLSTLILFSCNPAHADTPEWITHITKGNIKLTEAIKISRAIYASSFKYNIDPAVLFKIAKVESNFNRKARSSHNAKGLFQIITRYHQDKIKGRDIYNVDVNSDVAAQIYKEYLTLYKTPSRALRAYNGSHRSNQYPLKIAAVKIIQYSMPYPGSDNSKYASLDTDTEQSPIVSFSLSLESQTCARCIFLVSDCIETELIDT